MVLPTAAAFEHPERIAGIAEQHFAPLGVGTRTLPVLNRRDAEDSANAKAVEHAKFVYLADGSPMRAVADHVVRTHNAGNQVVVVVSAMGKTTDDLERLANDVSSNPSAREMDMRHSSSGTHDVRHSVTTNFSCG